MSHNKFTGSISFPAFTNFTKPVYLSFNYNQLTGGIPSSLANLTHVAGLSVSYNQLTGNLPSAFSPDLKYLNVDHNQFSGSIPSSISNNTSFTGVSIDNNQFTFDGMEEFAQASYKANTRYAPQANIPIHQKDFQLSVSAGGTLENNVYKWYNGTQLIIIKYGDSTFTPSVRGNYSVQVTNTIASQLTLNGTATNVSSVSFQLCASGDIITSDIAGTNYQWQVNSGSGFTNIGDNSNYSGSNTGSLQLNNIPSAWYAYQYRCVVDGTYSTIFSLQFVNRWTGAIDSFWENPGNWSCGIVPDSNTDVIISSGTVLLNSNTTIRSLKVSPDVIFTVNAGFNLTITH